MKANQYDVIVVGGGHAGIEAAWAAAQLGCATALVTMRRDAIGRMSCNPAIGGLGKGHMVREIDALGGLMGQAIDRAGIQFRMLNRSKGPAVQAPRAQADRRRYVDVVTDLLASARNLDILEGTVEAIETQPIPAGSTTHADESDAARDIASAAAPSTATPITTPVETTHRIRGVVLADGRRLRAETVILTTGTFLRGLMHCGDRRTRGGRVGEPAAAGLSRMLIDLGFQLGRLKTGTPPRLHRDTLDYDRLETQPGDDVPVPFSFMTDGITRPQVDCWITHTNATVHDLIRDNLHRAPMYSGRITSTGPRYCPSIEDKVVRFADKPRHQVFLEPEGPDDERVYCNGISTSLPADVQESMVHGIAGLENARILQHGYAVEYDWVPTFQTRFSLETKRVAGLYLAGQINGTSGYEEAAGQGLIAGINAARSLAGADPVILRRDQAYLGVMIDDLMTKPHAEPYRMFTSRAEYRLALRSDNADQRLTPLGRDIGLVGDTRWHRYERKRDALDRIRRTLPQGRVGPLRLTEWVKRPEADLPTFADAIYDAADQRFGIDDLEQVFIESRYRGYLDRQARQIEQMRRLETLTLPPDLDYHRVPQLKTEAREHLTRVRPCTLGQAGRIPGITPADVTVLWVHVTSRRPPRQRPA